MDEWMDGRVDGWMDGWMDSFSSIQFFYKYALDKHHITEKIRAMIP